MKRYTRTPYYKGEDDPEIGEGRGPLKLGETVAPTQRETINARAKKTKFW